MKAFDYKLCAGVAITTCVWGWALAWAWCGGWCVQAVVSAMTALVMTIVCMVSEN